MKPKTFGNITVSRVVELEEPMMKPAHLWPASNPETIESYRNWLAPNFIDPSGTLIMSIQSCVVRTSHHTILVDTCVGNHKDLTLEHWHIRDGPYLEDMRAAGVLNCEMEAGVVLTLSALFGLRAGCICVVSDRTPWPGPATIDLDRNMAECIEVANAAMLAAARR